jgi:hypothetical protein
MWDITDASAVMAAVAEYDRLGRAAFLHRHQYGRAREYVLVVDGREYDSKAIVGVAHGYQFPKQGPLVAQGGGFSGGRRTVKVVLERMGFTVIERLGGPQRDD